MDRMYTIRHEYLQAVKSLDINVTQMAVRSGILVADPLRQTVMVCCICHHDTGKILDDKTREQFCELLGIPNEVVDFEVPYE